jgi:hypothetical protein
VKIACSELARDEMVSAKSSLWWKEKRWKSGRTGRGASEGGLKRNGPPSIEERRLPGCSSVVCSSLKDQKRAQGNEVKWRRATFAELGEPLAVSAKCKLA